LVDVKLPQLETLCLEHVFICDDLLRVLAAHANTVKYLSLKDCYGNFEQDNDFSWRDLFNRIIDTDCLALEGLEIEPSQGERTRVSDWTVQSLKTEVKRFHEVLQQAPGRRIFAYGILDDKNGFLNDDERQNVFYFLQGDDQRAYDRLMEVVDANKSRSKPRKRI
jgi:hypothetical protein